MAAAPAHLPPPAAAAGGEHHPGRGEALRYWLRLGWINFGGPAGQIALLHRDLVERRRWISEDAFLHALNFCMLLPGPEAQQLATYVGWRLHGTRGALAAGILFVLPSVLVLWALSWLYAALGHLPAVAGALGGIKPMVVAIVAEAVVLIGRRAWRQPIHLVLGAAAFAALQLARAPFPAIVGAAALLGAAAERWGLGGAPEAGSGSSAAAASATALPHPVRRTVALVVAGLALWALPLAAASGLAAQAPVLADLYGFFTRAAFVTFGGAYAVLTYVAQVAVERFGWLSHAAMIDGLALAETTPGPLIMVLQFVGFQAGWNSPGGLPPLAAATAGALLTTWATFLPSLLLVLAGAPWIERLRGQRTLAAALAGVTAAAVGVVLDLGVRFGRTALAPAGTLDPLALALAAGALVALVRFRVEAHWVVAAGALAGLARLALAG